MILSFSIYPKMYRNYRMTDIYIYIYIYERERENMWYSDRFSHWGWLIWILCSQKELFLIGVFKSTFFTNPKCFFTLLTISKVVYPVVALTF